jgi:proteasome lid subunit RPN8/RPN11
MSTLRMPLAVYAEMRLHGEQTYPHECCGVLLGHPAPEGWRVESAVRAGNTRTDSAHNRYQISPLELVRIEREARRQGLEIAGFYHSHPDHPAQWSPTDFAEAHWIGCSYVITQVAHGKAAVTNAFLLAGTTEEEKRFDPQAIAIDDDSHSGPQS